MKRNFLILIVLILAFGCRGGGANPSNNVSIPIIEPTPSDMYCQNQYYVESYPQLETLNLNSLSLDETGIEYFVFEEGSEEKPNLVAFFSSYTFRPFKFSIIFIIS